MDDYDLGALVKDYSENRDRMAQLRQALRTQQRCVAELAGELNEPLSIRLGPTQNDWTLRTEASNRGSVMLGAAS